MSSPREAQHRVVHGLSAELHGLHAVEAQALKHRIVYGIGPGGEADRVDLAQVQGLLCRSEQRLLLLRGDGGEAAPIKRQLPLSSLGEKGGCLRYAVFHVLRCRRPLCAGDAALVAEDAGVGTAQMRHKHRQDVGTGAHSRTFSSALQAAICSASFLVLPLPRPETSPLMSTSKVKVLSWSGPLSSTRR